MLSAVAFDLFFLPLGVIKVIIIFFFLVLSFFYEALKVFYYLSRYFTYLLMFNCLLEYSTTWMTQMGD